MKVSRGFLLVIFSVITFSAAAQETAPLNATWKDSARIYIRQLKEGALLVRLHSRAVAIAKLRAVGNTRDANTIESIQREENKEIVRAFRIQFDFCKVYFFFGDSTDAILLGKRSGFFLNDSLQIDPAISLKENFFMIAEKGNPDLQHKYDPTQQSNQDKSERSLLNETIVVLDQNLNQLKRPFPYYAQETFPQSLISTNWAEKVKALNRKLFLFYRKSL
jgi:hypothetical protein